MRQRALEERVLVAGRALDQQQAAAPPGRLDQHAAGVVLAGDLAGSHRHRQLVDRRRARIRRHREHRVHGRPVGGSDTADVDRPAVGGQGHLERLAAVAGAERRHVDVDGRIGEPRLPRRHRHHLAVAGDGRRPDADGEDRRRRGVAQQIVAEGGVAAVGDQDDAAQRAAAIALGDRGQRPADVGAAGRGLQPAEIAGRHAVAEGPHLGAERGSQCRDQRLGGAARPLQAGRTVGIGDPHAPRHVDEDRHDPVAGRHRRHQAHRPQHCRHQQHQRQRPQPGQQPPRPRRDRGAGVGVPGQGQARREHEHVAPDRQRYGEPHRLGLLSVLAPGRGK